MNQMSSDVILRRRDIVTRWLWTRPRMTYHLVLSWTITHLRRGYHTVQGYGEDFPNWLKDTNVNV